MLAAAILALWSVTGIAVWLGRHLDRAVHPRTLERASAAVFACVGLAFAVRTLW